MSLLRRAFLGAACLLLLSRPLAATLYVADNDRYLFGNLDQHNTNMNDPFGSWGCGPTAVTNSMVYLERGYPWAYPNYSLVPLADPNNPTQAEMAMVANTLGTAGYMNTTKANGTWWDMLIYGTQLYIEQKQPNVTNYYAETEYTWFGHAAPIPPIAKPAWVMDGMPNGPTLADLVSKIGNWWDVEVLIESTDFGHYVTATGITFDDAAGAGFLRYIDPWDGTYKTSNMQWSNTGQLQVQYGGMWRDVTATFDQKPECPNGPCEPVPEPGTWALLFGGLAWLVVRRASGSRQARDLAV